MIGELLGIPGVPASKQFLRAFREEISQVRWVKKFWRGNLRERFNEINFWQSKFSSRFDRAYRVLHYTFQRWCLTKDPCEINPLKYSQLFYSFNEYWKAQTFNGKWDERMVRRWTVARMQRKGEGWATRLNCGGLVILHDDISNNTTPYLLKDVAYAFCNSTTHYSLHDATAFSILWRVW